MFERYVWNSEPCILTAEGVATLYYHFKRMWGLEAASLHLVGSSVTGFSIKPSRRWQPFDFNNSDFDVAIVDHDFFDDTWQEVHERVAAAGGYFRRQDEFNEH